MKWKKHRIWVEVIATDNGKYCAKTCPYCEDQSQCYLTGEPEKLEYATGTFGEYFTTPTCNRRIKSITTEARG